MPCRNEGFDRSDPRKDEACRVQTLIDELSGRQFNKDNYDGCHHNYTNRSVTQKELDNMTAALCEKLQKTDATKYSLELQMWWRDHQAADKRRTQIELDKAKTENDKKKAIAKLTPHERKLFGFNQGS